MVPCNSLDEVNLIAALLSDVHVSHEVVFNARALRLTVKKLQSRCSFEGLSFLTKALPRLGKAFDKALSDASPMNSIDHGFKPMSGSNLPIFMGEFFSRVLHNDGTVLQDPCVLSIRVIRQILYLFYKYGLPYNDKQEQKVIASFEKTEQDLQNTDTHITEIDDWLSANTSTSTFCLERLDVRRIARSAKRRLLRLFQHFDPQNIYPKHGPGAVATRQRLWDKYKWSNICGRITDMYPLDAYFYASLGHFCDMYRGLEAIGTKENPALVLLVPKDSRGPRLISCEPVDFQWVQQGLGSAVVRHVEHHPLTKWNVFFTNQLPNQFGALLGSESGKYATLDLNEASDRVSVDLVHLLFPEYLYRYLSACRSLSTVLPDKREIKLRKFAPMGSALCFPILALTIWSLLTAAAPDKDTRESILVYGDDVIVPTAFAADAMLTLESFGLKINRDKSCVRGFFRESCGVDAFKGVRVTPIKLRSVWTHHPCPDTFASWVAYANSMYRGKYFNTYEYIVRQLTKLYWPIADESMHNAPISLIEAPEQARPVPRRWNPHLQRCEFRTLEVKALTIRKEMSGWDMLLRHFAESARPNHDVSDSSRTAGFPSQEPFSVRLYTKRRSSILVRRWR